MIKIFILVLSISLVGCKKSSKVIIIKQWHLGASQNTIDISSSKKLPQYTNQKDIYTYVKKKILADETKLIISEGCEGEIDKNFTKKFNGWNYNLLKSKKDESNFVDILTLAPLKLKVKFPNTQVICGDSDVLIKNNTLSFSDLRGHVGFFSRLLSAKEKGQLNLFEQYKKAYFELIKEKNIDNVIQLAKEKTLISLDLAQSYINQRNNIFIKNIKKNIDKNPILIIGGLHTKDLIKKLQNEKIEYEVYTPIGYNDNESELLNKFKSIINSYSNNKVIYYQVPERFKITDFPIKNLIDENKLARGTELRDLKKKCSQFNINFDLLRSDLDNDGIRDFTLSTGDSGLIISAEDNDWDGDGVSNLFDENVGGIEVSINKKIDFENRYLLQGINPDLLIKDLKKIGITLLQSKSIKHELLIVYFLYSILLELKDLNLHLEGIHATKPYFSYGKHAFFSYNKQSKVIEYNPISLYNYILKKKEESFKSVGIGKFVKEFVSPLVYHSLTHEIGHSLLLEDSIAKKFGKWSWTDKKIDSLYLISNRLPEKKITSLKKNVAFENKLYSSWKKEINSYIKERSSLVKKYKEKAKFKSVAKKSKYYTGIKSDLREFQMSLLHKYQIPSYYAFSKPSEWIAESFASCMFLNKFKNSSSLQESIRYELLIGLYPRAVKKDFCDFLLK